MNSGARNICGPPLTFLVSPPSPFPLPVGEDDLLLAAVFPAVDVNVLAAVVKEV